MAGTRGRTARGVLVDFDILKIKAQLANAPKPVEVQERENYIAQKGKRRRTKKEEPQLEVISGTTAAIMAPQSTTAAP